MTFLPRLAACLAFLAHLPLRADAPSTNAPGTGPTNAAPVPASVVGTSTPASGAETKLSPPGTNGKTANGVAITRTPGNQSTQNKLPAAVQPGKSPAVTLDIYLNELTTDLKLTGEQKKDVQSYYLADAPQLQGILNSDSIPPVQQAQQVDDLRRARNEKIDALLEDPDRKHEFGLIEAKYRVALTELAANGTLTPPQPVAPAPAPSQIPPGAAEPDPQIKNPQE